MIRAAFLALLLASPAWAQQSVATRDCSPVAVGDNNVQTITCGYSIEQHEAALARREAQLKAELEQRFAETQRANEAERKLLGLELAEVQRQRADLEASYEKTVQELANLRARISDIGTGIEQAKIEEAREALVRGDRSAADALFAEVERLEQERIDRAAEAAFQRGLIAEQEIRWADAADHFAKAARLVPSDGTLFKAQSLAWKAGRYQTGYRFAVERTELTPSLFGEKSLEHATALNQLAIMQNEVGNYDEAGDLFSKSAAIYRSLLGDDHPSYATVLGNIATVKKLTGNYAEAEKVQRQAIEIERRSIGEDHPSFGKSLNNLALILMRLRRFEEAEPLLRRAKDITASTVGEEHPTYAFRLGNLASLLIETRRIEEAEAIRHREYQILLSALGPKHPHVATASNNLGFLLHVAGKLEEAEPYYRQALEIDKVTVGTAHQSYARNLGNLATLLGNMKRADEAAPLFGEAVEVYREAVGVEHPDTRMVAANYARFLREQMPDAQALVELETTYGPEIGR